MIKVRIAREQLNLPGGAKVISEIKEEFEDLRGLTDYIFENAGFKVSDEPKPDAVFTKNEVSFTEYGIEGYQRANNYTRTIRNEDGKYLFSDGVMTGGKKICSEQTEDWLKFSERLRKAWAFETDEETFDLCKVLTTKEQEKILLAVTDQADLDCLVESADALVHAKILPEMSEEEMRQLAEKALPRFNRYIDRDDVYWEARWNTLSNAVEDQYKEEKRKEKRNA